MAMYYQGSSEIQADGLQTLYLMNPNYVGYSDIQQTPQSNMLFLNSAAATATTTTVHALNSALMPHAPLPQAQQFVGIPLSHDPSRPSPVLGQQEDHIQAAHNTIPRFHYNIWGLVDQAAANGNQTNMPQQQTPRGLSLSLSAHQTGFDKSLNPSDQDFPAGQSSIGMISPKNCSSPSLTATESNGVNTMQSLIMGSKYLKAAQELLDEVANVGKDTKTDRAEGSRDKAKIIKDSIGANASSAREGESGYKDELTTAQRQEIQMKKAKLNSMLDEVEQRCRQYHQQMQIVVASFEQAAGIGSARSYTQLALKTILKQFRCLKATITSQIKALSKSLGGEECLDKKFEGSRLKFVDHQLRQQRALQRLGMIQNNAWRPQRGLPERAVSVLRAWLFEHFLHPYPKDSDKQMLAKQTGLTRSQVSNWFINARVRLWKPMVEEMYLEETKNQDQITSEDNSFKGGPDRELGSNSNARQENNSKTARMDPSPTAISASTVTASPTEASLQARAGFAQHISSLNMENLPEKNPKKPRNENSLSSILSAEMELKAGETSKGFNNIKFSSDHHGQTTENYLSMAAANINRYGIGELGRFSADQQLATGFHGNNFSLTLGLPPTETPQGAHQQNFLSHRNFEFGTRIESEAVENSRINHAAAASHPSIAYEILDYQNRKPFPAQLLPDFVA